MRESIRNLHQQLVIIDRRALQLFTARLMDRPLLDNCSRFARLHIHALRRRPRSYPHLNPTQKFMPCRCDSLGQKGPSLAADFREHVRLWSIVRM